MPNSARYKQNQRPFASSVAKAVEVFKWTLLQGTPEGTPDLIKSNSYIITEDTKTTVIKPIAIRDNERLLILLQRNKLFG